MEDSLLDSEVSLPGQGGALASPGVEQPRRRLGRLRKAGTLEQAAAQRGENAAPNAAADSLVSIEQPLGDEEQPGSPAVDQELQDEELEAEDAVEGRSEAAGGEVRRHSSLPLRASPLLGCPDRALVAPLIIMHPSTLPQDYFDEEDELEEAYAQRATQKAARRAAPAAESAEGELLAYTPAVWQCCMQPSCSWEVWQLEIRLRCGICHLPAACR